MEALLVIDVQNGLVNQKKFNIEIDNIKELVKFFNNKNKPVILTKFLDDDAESPLYKKGDGVEILEDFIGTVLDWSKVIDVLYFEEYKKEYIIQS